MISSVFIHRPRLAMVIAIVISIAGVIALGALPVAQFPDIVPPQVGVSATYPGASAAAVEESVAQVIESQVNGVDKMIYMKSTSGGDGSYSLNVTFQVGSDPDLNTVNVTNRVNQALAQLPPEVSRNGVTTKKASTSLLQVVAIYSPKGTRDALFLSNYAKINIVDALKRVPGVGDAGQWGDLEYSMRIWLNLDRMASLDITPEDVVNAINSQNTQAAVGRVGAAPLVPEVEFQLNISTQGRLTTVEEFNNIIVRATPDGGVVRIKDIARTELGSKSADSLVRYNGRPGEAIFINQSPGANAMAVAAGVKKALKEIEPRLPEDVAYEVMYDTTVFVDAMIHKVQKTLLEAFVLVGIVVFIFLGSLRATLIPIIAVPVALVGTFAVMLAMGFSANTISLLALVLAIGIVVDDAIIVVEAVEHILETEPRPDACRSSGKSDVAGDRSDHRNHPRPALGLRADGLRAWNHWPAIPAIRGGGGGVDGHFVNQCTQPLACLVRVTAQTPRPSKRAHRLPPARHRQEPRRICGAGAAAGAPGTDNRGSDPRLCPGDRVVGEDRTDRLPSGRGSRRVLC